MNERTLSLEADECTGAAAGNESRTNPCGPDPDIRDLVGAIRLADDSRLLATPTLAQEVVGNTALPPDRQDPDPLIGTVVAGRYTLVGKLGEGGMGSVYRAEQTDPVRRTVALKLVKAAGIGSHTVLERFGAERQALALMTHPNIARVCDAGATADDQPFFVMELVEDAVPITTYCDAHRLTPRERLELFVPVCEAIQHAHQKGVIHRDIKADNVLVGVYDGRPVPKVIDFGLAKATAGPLAGRTRDTAFGAVIGTLLYLSPEQAALTQADVDTRSDVYALGVLLYELLTGTTPVTGDEILGATLVDALARIHDTQPPPPSTRAACGPRRVEAAAARGTDPARLARWLRGEVDWIVMKALEKDRDRRYPTAFGLAQDLRRFLCDEVVEARPPGAVYRLRKFARRHRGPVVAAGLVFAALVLGIAGTLVGLARAIDAEKDARAGWAGEAEQRREADRLRAEADRRRAEAVDWALQVEEQRGAAVGQRQRAEGERARAEGEKARADASARRARAAEAEAVAVLGFLRDRVLAAGRPVGQAGGLGREVTLRKALDAAEQQIGGAFRDQPLAEASVRHVLGQSYTYLGEPGPARRQTERAYHLRAAALGPDHPDTLSSLNNLAYALQSAGDPKAAIPMYRDCLGRMEARLGPDHPDTLTCLNNLAGATKAVGDLKRAVPMFEDCLARRERALGKDHPDTLASLNNLAGAYQAAGDPRRAVLMYRSCLGRMEALLGKDHPDALTCLNNLAGAYEAAGDLNRAVPMYRDCLTRREEKLGPDHPDTLTSLNNLAGAYEAAGDAKRAVPMFEDCLARRERALGKDHPDTLTSLNNLAYALRSAGDAKRAVRLFEDCLGRLEARLGPDSPASNMVRKNLEATRAKLDK